MKRTYSRPSEWDSFVLYKSFFAPIESLTDEQMGRLFRCLFHWQADGEAEPAPDIEMAFRFIVNQFRIDDEKRLEKSRKSRENIKKRWYTTEYDGIRPNTTVYHNENENENETENRNVESKHPRKSKVKDKDLKLPFNDPEFIDTWNVLRHEPKWKSKSAHALQTSLDKLSKYDVKFAIILMQNAIEKDYQGVVYDNTPEQYQKWLNGRTQAEQPPVKYVKPEDVYF